MAVTVRQIHHPRSAIKSATASLKPGMACCSIKPRGDITSYSLGRLGADPSYCVSRGGLCRPRLLATSSRQQLSEPATASNALCVGSAGLMPSSIDGPLGFLNLVELRFESRISPTALMKSARKSNFLPVLDSERPPYRFLVGF